jgi:hypothetical protein
MGCEWDGRSIANQAIQQVSIRVRYSSIAKHNVRLLRAIVIVLPIDSKPA